METRPDPTLMRPELTWKSHAWRYAVCLVISVAIWQEVAVAEAREHRLLLAVELLLGLLAYALVFFRRLAPVPVALAIAAMSAFSGIAAGPATLAAVSVATLRRPWQIIVIGLANLAAAQTYTTVVAPFDLDSVTVTTFVNVAVNAGMMGWGMYLGSRRELLWTLRARAERAESERELRILGGAPPSVPRSPARCTTCSPTGSPRCRCRPAPWRSARTSTRADCGRASPRSRARPTTPSTSCVTC